MALAYDRPQTLAAASPRGTHMVFTVPEFTPLGNWTDVLQTKKHQGAALDLRYARGRIVVEPSVGATGAYRWINRCEPAPLPPEVTGDILARRARRGLDVQFRWSRDGKSP